MIRMSRFLSVLAVVSTTAGCDGQPGGADPASTGQTGNLQCGAVGCRTGLSL